MPSPLPLNFALAFAIGFLNACAGPRAGASAAITTTERDAPLRAGVGAIGGVVRDEADGLPLAMVMVLVYRDSTLVSEDVSDHKGVYRVGPLAPGNYRLTARFANASVVYESVVVRAREETEVRVALDLRPQGDRSTTSQSAGELGAIGGVVLDGVDGAIIPGTVVSLQAEHLAEPVMAIADEEGRFRFKSLRPAVYSLSCYYQLVEQGSVEIRRGNIVVEPGQTTEVQFPLDLRIP